MTPTKAAPRTAKLPPLGSHMSIAGGAAKAFDRGESVGCTAMQIFVKNNTRWQFPPLRPEDARAFRERRASSPIQSVIAHAIYLVNLAALKDDVHAKSLDDVADELARCDALGVEGLVLHPGAHGGAGIDAGIERIAASLNGIFDRHPGTCRVLLETTAGQGQSVGGRVEHIASLLAAIRHPDRVGVCVDTCHIFVAGYDIRTRKGYDAFWREFDERIGRDRLFAVHLNDSKGDLGSHLDRHEHIGKGKLGLEPFQFLMNDASLRHIPMVLETDKDDDLTEDRENLATLRSLAQ